MSDRDFRVMVRVLELLPDYKPINRRDGERRRLGLCLLRKIRRTENGGKL